MKMLENQNRSYMVHAKNLNTSFWIGSNPPRKFAEHGSQRIFFVWVTDISLKIRGNCEPHKWQDLQFLEIFGLFDETKRTKDVGCSLQTLVKISLGTNDEVCSNEKPTHILNTSDQYYFINTFWSY